MLDLSLERISTGFDGESGYCYVHARGAVAPDGRAIMTTQRLRLTGSDVFSGLEMLAKSGPAAPWSGIRPCQNLRRITRPEGFDLAICDATPVYHKATGKFLLTSHTVTYVNDTQTDNVPFPRHTAWSVFDDAAGEWTPYSLLPIHEGFGSSGAGSTQIHELPDGTLLIPVYGKMAEKDACYGASVLHCAFDGATLKFLETGNFLTLPAGRGLYEPSIAAFKGKFFLCLRNDDTSYVAVSNDGLHFNGPIEWRFDDGAPLGSYNTQQHWLVLGDRLYLIYTRRGAGNDHVFRHRAPLFIAEVDDARLCIRRGTEQIAVPERGARLGNFGCCKADDETAYIFAAEWMQTTGPDHYNFRRCMSYGSDNSIFVIKATPRG